MSSSSSLLSSSWNDNDGNNNNISSLGQQSLIRCIPPLSGDNYKGSSGRIGILGGSKRYTGAPYYAAMASLKVGADLSFVFCAEEAAIPIKCYSPELMVAPVYQSKEFDTTTTVLPNNEQIMDSNSHAQQLVDDMVHEVTSMMDKLHALVIGPGLGRCPMVFRAVSRIIQEAQSKHQLPLVLDADALFLLTQPEYWQILTNDSIVVLTPNAMERKRLDESNVVLPDTCVILEKGATDKIQPVNQQWQSFHCQEVGGLKRSGGIGDVLAGTVGTVLAWNNILTQQGSACKDDVPLACWTACCFVKRATKVAFGIHQRGMTAPDVLHALGPSINDMTNNAVNN
ncbi:ATP-dependent (S)-NAD(P)H-hydrate dehydratase [Nitzschia inconspicua]|uniref:ATP-dependent (S)-NAD(P)H-hydrate dehydratase n=1 Tax=Nitzschia inconspicua TaxID=303405 RepID=A0A9K3K9G7_9STRA|nr:YjeF family protein [Nitzschia inconspicua]KAG7362422.1 ATP-dependent (S)-NAD(P)H-hydrate dehydratase [Nitzschia inconspicua]